MVYSIPTPDEYIYNNTDTEANKTAADVTEKTTEGVANLFQFHPLLQSLPGRQKLKHSICVSSPV